MYIAILGRQPALGMAELERLYGSKSVRWFSDESAIVDNLQFDFEQLGGSQKAGRVVAELSGDWRRASMEIVHAYTDAWRSHEGKITLGISAYGFKTTARDVQKTGIILKQKLKSHGVSLRVIPNAEPALNTAASHHNKLGLSNNHVELLVVRTGAGKIIVAESVGAQNITALAARDQARPKTDAFVGMLPPKLARIMVNMAVGSAAFTSFGEDSAFPAAARQEAPANSQLAPSGSETKDGKHSARIAVLDPFCGTGVVLQEAALLGYDVYGTDLSEKMVDYSTQNLDWLVEKHRLSTTVTIEEGDAMTHTWPLLRTQNVELKTPLAVVAETYLGQPFSAPPSPAKLREVVGNCNHIIGEFLRNLHPQLPAGTSLCLAVPAWRDAQGRFTHLPLTTTLEKFGYARVELATVRPEQLLYYRETQVVARELLILKST